MTEVGFHLSAKILSHHWECSPVHDIPCPLFTESDLISYLSWIFCCSMQSSHGIWCWFSSPSSTEEVQSLPYFFIASLTFGIWIWWNSLSFFLLLVVYGNPWKPNSRFLHISTRNLLSDYPPTESHTFLGGLKTMRWGISKLIFLKATFHFMLFMLLRSIGFRLLAIPFLYASLLCVLVSLASHPLINLPTVSYTHLTLPTKRIV